MLYVEYPCVAGDDMHPCTCYAFGIDDGFYKPYDIELYHDLVSDEWFGDVYWDDGCGPLGPEDLTRYVTMIKDEINKKLLRKDI